MCKHSTRIGSCVAIVFSLAGTAAGDDSAVIADLQSRIRQLEGEVWELRADRRETWLTRERADELRGLIADVLADADTRVALYQGGLTAGHDGKFFLATDDGRFRLNLGGHLQVRYVYNVRDAAAPGDDEDVSGFAVRRSKFKGSGHIGDPKIGFGFNLASDSDTESAYFADYYATYTFDNGLELQGGRFKQPFARGNITSSSRQLAVERSAVLETFNVDRSEGVMLSGGGDGPVRFAVAASNGLDGQAKDWDFTTAGTSFGGATDFAVTGRIDLLLAGNWKQMRDYTAWRGEDVAAFLGAAAHYQEGETDGATDGDEILLLTLDGSIETGGFNIGAAVYYSDVTDASVSMASIENYGFEVFAGYMLTDTFEPYVRYEYIDFDSMIAANAANGDNDVSFLTLGFNQYHRKHNAKLSMDVVLVLDSIDDGASTQTGFDPSAGLGLLDDFGQQDGQIVVRTQYQLAF